MKHFPYSNLKEDVSHGDILLPFQYYRSIFTKEHSTLPIHWHEEAEITLIQEGTSRYVIDFETYELEEGDIILISPQVLHSAQLTNGQTMVSETYVFHLDMLNGKTMDGCSIKYVNPLQNGTNKFPPVIKPSMKGYAKLLACINELKETFLTPSTGYELMIKHDLFQIIYQLYHNDLVNVGTTKSASKQIEEKLKDILGFIEEHYNEPLTIQQLADLCNFSKCHFMNFFKKYVGISCMEYIIEYRLNEVAAMLPLKEGSITSLAMDVGFNNISYFNRAFKRKFGVTPKRYGEGVKGE